MSARKPNPLEQKLHQAALADPKKTLSQNECETLIPESSARTAALNFLLGTGLMKAMKDAKGVVSFRAVMKKELEVKKDMSGEEAMILNYIQAAADEGIWTKHLKAKTELHQTIIDRCLKSLTQKQLVKSVKSVKYPTRKIYMLFHLEPSVEMTGGPWYTDNELDTEFIKLLCNACHRFIRDRSMPKHKSTEASSESQLLYPISAAPAYPTAQQVLTFLGKSGITETQLSVEHVEMLLNVLVLGGEIERVPAFGAGMWDTSGAAGDESDDERGAKERKRKRKGRHHDDSPIRDRKRSKRGRSSDSDNDGDSNSEDERARRKTRKKTKSKGKNKSRAGSSDVGENGERWKRKKKRTRDSSDDEEADAAADEDEDMNGGDQRRKHKRKKGKRRASQSASSSSESDDSSSDDDRRARSRSKSKSSTRSKRKRSSSPAGEDVTASFLPEEYGAYVYRAITVERTAGGGGGIAQAPCVRCPTFEFCSMSGPVNPGECTYLTGWLSAPDIAKG